ncbi:DUF3592 domain-containing protein [Candidatus Magnetaquicoccus inordinatus]|uniref:DUF3592 domain-containing protein n=1 Tax=Candidatus Magnetaquicoccus inordinatus TaxID=2496818 RepID=UPI00102C852C|nr:DUF3592 domain-containing protein [Candidatus Magnetaquicoccus inordinatus]
MMKELSWPYTKLQSGGGESGKEEATTGYRTAWRGLHDAAKSLLHSFATWHTLRRWQSGLQLSRKRAETLQHFMLQLKGFIPAEGGFSLFAIGNHWLFWLRSLLLLIGVVLCSIGAYPFYQAVHSQGWQMVDGTIIHSGFVQKATTFSAEMKLFYYTSVQYEYIFDRQRYQGEDVEFGLADQTFFFREFAERILQRYPHGKPVRVYVNPQKPQKAVLERTPSMGGGFLLILVGGFCLMSRSMLGKSYQHHSRMP